MNSCVIIRHNGRRVVASTKTYSIFVPSVCSTRGILPIRTVTTFRVTRCKIYIFCFYTELLYKNPLLVYVNPSERFILIFGFRVEKKIINIYIYIKGVYVYEHALYASAMYLIRVYIYTYACASQIDTFNGHNERFYTKTFQRNKTF